MLHASIRSPILEDARSGVAIVAMGVGQEIVRRKEYEFNPFNRTTKYDHVLKQAKRIVEQHDRYGVTTKDLAERFSTSVATIRKILKEAKRKQG